MESDRHPKAQEFTQNTWRSEARKKIIGQVHVEQNVSSFSIECLHALGCFQSVQGHRQPQKSQDSWNMAEPPVVVALVMVSRAAEQVRKGESLRGRASVWPQLRLPLCPQFLLLRNDLLGFKRAPFRSIPALTFYLHLNEGRNEVKNGRIIIFKRKILPSHS